jgi:hypothetical protein
MSPFEETDDVTQTMSQDMTEGGVSTSSWDAPLTMLGSVADLVSHIAAFLGPEMLGHHMLELKLQVYLSHPIVALVHNFLHQAMRTSGIISAKGDAEERGEAIFASCLSSCSGMGKRDAHNYQPLPSSASLGLKERCLARCLTVSGSHRRIRSRSA